MNNKMNIFVVVGIVTLSLLAIKPISNQVLAQTNETSTQQASIGRDKRTKEPKMILNTLWTIILVIIAIIIIVVLLKFLFAVLVILPTDLNYILPSQHT